MNFSIMIAIIALIFQSSQAFSATDKSDKSNFSCRSANVVDAGYSVHVYYESKKHFGSIYAQTFAGETHQYFFGSLFLIELSPHNDLLLLTDSIDPRQRKVELIVSPTGYGRILKLDGQNLPQDRKSFTDLVCHFNDKIILDSIN